MEVLNNENKLGFDWRINYRSFICIKFVKGDLDGT